jgi:nitrogen fixation NifU-like protein
MDLYAENILDHYRRPRGKAPLPGATVTHHERNASCGDDLTLSLAIKDGAVAGVGWDGQGCAISQAGMSILGEQLAGKTVAEAAALTPAQMLAWLGVPVGPRRQKCALLALHALRNTLRAAHGQPPAPWAETLAD